MHSCLNLSFNFIIPTLPVFFWYLFSFSCFRLIHCFYERKYFSFLLEITYQFLMDIVWTTCINLLLTYNQFLILCNFNFNFLIIAIFHQMFIFLLFCQFCCYFQNLKSKFKISAKCFFVILEKLANFLLQSDQ